MKNNKFIVEIDTDGVLANMDGSYTPYIGHIVPYFTEEEHITDWGIPYLKENYPEALKIISDLYVNPGFIRTLPRYENVEKYLKDIYEVVNKYNGLIVVHTHILSSECAIARELWLKDLRSDANVDFDIDICVGSEKKTRQNSLILIEDNINNLKKSSAPYKILMRRCHNRNYGLNDIGSYEEGFIVKDLSNVADIIERVLQENLNYIESDLSVVSNYG